MKLCVFQGTFNPIHTAHVRLVNFVLKNFNYDKILVIPAYKPPHKDYNPEMALHRFNMARIAFKDIEKVEVSNIEFQRNETSYTYNTICELYTKFNIDGKISFIIGTDAFKNIEQWYKADELKKLVKFIVFKREEDFSQEKYKYLQEKGFDFEFQILKFKDISSSDLRNKIKNGENITNFLDNKVKEYIIANDLYKN